MARRPTTRLDGPDRVLDPNYDAPDGDGGSVLIEAGVNAHIDGGQQGSWPEPGPSPSDVDGGTDKPLQAEGYGGVKPDNGKPIANVYPDEWIGAGGDVIDPDNDD